MSFAKKCRELHDVAWRSQITEQNGYTEKLKENLQQKVDYIVEELTETLRDDILDCASDRKNMHSFYTIVINFAEHETDDNEHIHVRKEGDETIIYFQKNFYELEYKLVRDMFDDSFSRCIINNKLDGIYLKSFVSHKFGKPFTSRVEYQFHWY